MRWLAVLALVTLSAMSMASTGVVSTIPEGRKLLFGVGLGAMFWAGAVVGGLLTQGPKR